MWYQNVVPKGTNRRRTYSKLIFTDALGKRRETTGHLMHVRPSSLKKTKPPPPSPKQYRKILYLGFWLKFINTIPSCLKSNIIDPLYEYIRVLYLCDWSSQRRMFSVTYELRHKKQMSDLNISQLYIYYREQEISSFLGHVQETRYLPICTTSGRNVLSCSL